MPVGIAKDGSLVLLDQNGDPRGPIRFYFLCQEDDMGHVCNFFSEGWLTEEDRDKRQAQHLEEHETKVPMPTIPEAFGADYAKDA